jgi:hypothetical protein
MAPSSPKKRRMTSGGSMVERVEAYKPPKPSFTITDADLPAIKDWAVGKKYNMELVVEMVHHAQGDEYSDGPQKNDHRARFSIVSIDSMPQENAGTKKGK